MCRCVHLILWGGKRSDWDRMLIRSGMVWGYWRVVARDIGGSAEKWWDYCIFCFSQQTAVAQAVTGVFSTPGCPAPQAPSHWFRNSLPLLFSLRLSTIYFTAIMYLSTPFPMLSRCRWVKLTLAMWQDVFCLSPAAPGRGGGRRGWWSETCNHLNASKAKWGWWTVTRHFCRKDSFQAGFSRRWKKRMIMLKREVKIKSGKQWMLW